MLSALRSDVRESGLHDLKNTLAALRLRFRVLSADPTCRWAQEENLTAITRMVEEAIATVVRLLDTPPASGAAKTARRLPRETGK